MSAEIVERLLANVDIWERIFAFLSVRDRIRVEMTSKGLSYLMLGCWRRVSIFDVAETLPLFTNPKKRSAMMVAICALRIGGGLRTLKLHDDGRSPYIPLAWTADLHLIGEECPNLNEITHTETAPSLPMAFCQNLRFDVFFSLKNLSFSIQREDFVNVSVEVFLSLPRSIEVIVGFAGITRFERDKFQTAAQLEAFFTDRPSLREVRLAHLSVRDGSTANVFDVIADRCRQLKKINFRYAFIDWSGVVALESMRELRLTRADFRDVSEICSRSPFLEVLELWCPFSNDMPASSIAAFDAIGELTKLVELCVDCELQCTAASMSDFIRRLVRNSGASLRRLELGNCGYFSIEAIEALANGCPMLRCLRFYVQVGEAIAASIRYLIDSVAARSSDKLKITVYCYGINMSSDEAAAFRALVSPEANLPADVALIVAFC